MDSQLRGPAPEVIDPGELVGTARSIARTATLAGYDVKATRAIGPRLPRQVSQQPTVQESRSVVGKMGSWAFVATHTDRDGWDVAQYRPGWPPVPGNTVTLLATLKAQTPFDLGLRPEIEPVPERPVKPTEPTRVEPSTEEVPD